ncbi:hypothetical protein IMCC3317_45500 [Kordia antarctica]|uniref:Uncharacterized protein n=1 Tax=Kordia antarctica TaxID=1218801 RepID=A0A7L4ZRP2_9FLAO|nr:hypothetical protein IMCC3317_45500 [Kordia antarctica]
MVCSFLWNILLWISSASVYFPVELYNSSVCHILIPTAKQV